MTSMQLVSDSISIDALRDLAQTTFGNLVKAVVDIEQKRMVIAADLHADEEQYLLNQGSHQSNLWGINLYPEFFGTDRFIEFDSMINVRPSQNNPSRSVLDRGLQAQIQKVVTSKITG